MKIKSAVFLNALNVAFTQLKTKMTVAQIAKMKLKAEQGNFVLFSEFGNAVNAADGVGGVDGALLHFFKTLTDSTALAEDAVLTFNKVLTETIGVAEENIISYGKPLGDATAITDVLVKNFPRAVVQYLLAASISADLDASGVFPHSTIHVFPDTFGVDNTFQFLTLPGLPVLPISVLLCLFQSAKALVHHSSNPFSAGFSP